MDDFTAARILEEEAQINGKRAYDVAPVDPGPYITEDGRICRVKFNEKVGKMVEPLCNFDAKITQEILLDDGAEPSRAFIVQGKIANGAPLEPQRIPASKFASMNWPTELWGCGAVVRAGSGSKDFLREAIQRLSPPPPLRHVFLHTGWREIKNKWIYLSGSTAGSGVFEVDLGPELSRYKLPAVTDDPAEAMRISLALLQIAPLGVTAPLWAAVYRAPLVCAFPQDLSLWLEGKTGSMKSTLAALFLSHFGDFDRLHLPGAWSSTANQLERRAFLLKDSLFVIDDYAPGALDQKEMQIKASRLLRSQGNAAGRGRLKADLTERAAFVPRGIVLCTGEQHPPGQSLLARTEIIEIDRSDINVDRLTQAQEQAPRLPHAMAGYVTWLAPQMADIPGQLRETFAGARAKASGGDGHLRIPEAAAHLWIGLHSGLTYAEDIGAIGAADAADIRARAWDAFIEIGREQAKVVEEEQPSRRFLGVLYTILTQGRAVIVPKDASLPDPRPGIDSLGWHDDEHLYLLPEATFSSVVKFCRDTGEHFPIRQERLKKDLLKDGISECHDGRLTATARIGGHIKRILKLRIRGIEDAIGVTGVTSSNHCNHFKTEERDGL